ncbi:MAG: rod shape-determining protein MreD [Gammaproteobacteria bacterium]|nr:rod shape-determining protein MreD [Gammaproteobacteria bacterium]
MSRDQGTSRLMIAVIAAVALLATAMPLPRWISVVRPDFVLLTVLWLCVMTPRSASLLFAFLCGLAMDAFTGLTLGENAFALVTVAYLASKFHLRIRMFPLGHQTLTVLSLAWLHQFVLFWIDGVAGHPVTDWMRWLPVLTGAATWPLLSGVYARLLVRR